MFPFCCAATGRDIFCQMNTEFSSNFAHNPASLNDCPALVLNADFRPLSYFPLSLWRWQDAVKASFQGRVSVIAQYDRVARSPTISINIPSVIVLKGFVRPMKTAAFTRFNLFLRDGFTCQYCGSTGDMTFDHVVPRARGGRTTWENVVASCGPCNLRKGALSLRQAHMHLCQKPVRPSPSQLLNRGRQFPPNHLHESWMDFLYWDTELEE